MQAQAGKLPGSGGRCHGAERCRLVASSRRPLQDEDDVTGLQGSLAKTVDGTVKEDAWMSSLEDAFGDIIRKARYGLGLTLDEVAAATEIVSSRLAAFENYTEKPTRSEVERLARLLRLGTEALWNAANETWRPDIPDFANLDFELQRIVFPTMNANGYILAQRSAQAALLVDPGGSGDVLVQRCTAVQLPFVACLITHAHADHVGALPQIRQAFPDAAIVVHRKAASQLGLEGDNVRVCDEDTSLQIGPFRVDVLLSPGHSADGLVFLLDNMAFVGDTLFAGSLGRSEKGPETYAQLLASARRIVDLPDRTALLPGHGPPTTALHERMHNPFLTNMATEGWQE